MGEIETISANLPLTWTFSELLFDSHIFVIYFEECRGRKQEVWYFLLVQTVWHFCNTFCLTISALALCTACKSCVIALSLAYLLAWNKYSFSFFPQHVHLKVSKHSTFIFFPGEKAALLEVRLLLQGICCSDYIGLLHITVRACVKACELLYNCLSISWYHILWSCCLYI